MDAMDKTRRFKQTVLCPKCGEEYSVTYKRCPFCGGASSQKRSSIDIQGPDLYDQPPVTVRPSVPNPPPPPPPSATAGVLDDILMDIDFTPELEDETSSVPKPPPGASGGKRLAPKGAKPPAPRPSMENTQSGTPKSREGGPPPPPPPPPRGGSGGRGAGRVFLIILSLLIIAAAGYIVVTKAVPMIQTILENRAQEGENPDGQGDPGENAPNFTLTEPEVLLTAPGATKQLIPVYDPPEEVGVLRWKSSDESIVTVTEEGRLTAVALGSTTVTVSRSDGTQAVCKVECSWDEDTLLENLTLNRVDFTMRASEPPVQMKVLGIEGTPPDIVWESKNPAVASITEDGLVHWVGTGSTQVTATINGGKLVLECDVFCR